MFPVADVGTLLPSNFCAELAEVKETLDVSVANTLYCASRFHLDLSLLSSLVDEEEPPLILLVYTI